VVVDTDNWMSGVPFGLQQAMVIPDSWETGLPSGKAIGLNFTDDVEIDTDKVGAVVAILNNHGNLTGPEGEISYDTGSSDRLLAWTAEIGELPDGFNCRYYVKLNGSKGYTVSDLMMIRDQYMSAYNMSGFTVSVRLYDKVNGDPTNFGSGSTADDGNASDKDHIINGITNPNDDTPLSSAYFCRWNGHTWGSATDAGPNTRDAFDMEITIDTEGASTFSMQQPMVIPDSWNTGLPSGKAILLPFTNTVRIDTTKVRAVVAILNNHENLTGPEGEVSYDAGSSDRILAWMTEIGEIQTEYGSRYYALLNGPKGYTVADIMGIRDRYMAAYNMSGFTVSIRLVDMLTGDPADLGSGSTADDPGGQDKDSFINGVVSRKDYTALKSFYYSHWNGHSWGASNPDANARDAFDMAILENPLTVTSTKMINKNQLLVTFSEPVAIDNPFISLRLVDGNNELIFSTRDAAGHTVRGAYGSGTAMQWSSTKWEYNSEAKDAIVVTFKTDLAVAMDASNLPAALSPTSNPEFIFQLCLEETNPTLSGDLEYNGQVCDVVSLVDASKKLLRTTTVAQGAWDGNYSPIVNPMAPDFLITATDAKITGENQLTFEWSHSVDLSDEGLYYACLRYVNTETGLLYGNDAEGWKQFGVILKYADEAKCKMTAHIVRDTAAGVYDLNDLLNPTGALKEYMDTHPGKWVLCIEEKGGEGGNGTIDSYCGVDGTTVQASPFIGAWNDGVYMDIVGTPIVGDLTVNKVEIISDTDIKVTFSAAIAYKQVDGKDTLPWVSVRLYNSNHELLFYNPITDEYLTENRTYDENGTPIHVGPNGYTTESEGDDGNGKWCNYAVAYNAAMQWGGTARWADDSHTAVIYTLSGAEQLPVKNITDILSYDFTSFIEGSYIAFDIEENTPGMIGYNGHVDNIVRADNADIALDANFFPNDRDSFKVEMEDIIIGYKPGKISAKTEIISDTQIRITFTQPVQIDNSPFMAVRMIDKNGDLMWQNGVGNSTPFQWYGDWKWEDETQTSMIWSMSGNGLLGGQTLHELANWSGKLAKYKRQGTWMFVIEELNNASNNFYVGMHNGLVDNVVSMDGTIHCLSTYSTGVDGILTALDMDALIGPRIELLSAQAIDEQTITLTFSDAVNISDEVSLGIRYLSESGDTDVLADGKIANFKGDWKYADDTKKVVTWTLNSKYADSLNDIVNYTGTLKWNKGARVAFVIVDADGKQSAPGTMRVNGVCDLTGYRRLVGNYATSDYPMLQKDIDFMYEVPAPEASAENGGEVQYIYNDVPFIVMASVLAAAGLVAGLILFVKRKKEQE